MAIQPIHKGPIGSSRIDSPIPTAPVRITSCTEVCVSVKRASSSSMVSGSPSKVGLTAGKGVLPSACKLMMEPSCALGLQCKGLSGHEGSFLKRKKPFMGGAMWYEPCGSVRRAAHRF